MKTFFAILLSLSMAFALVAQTPSYYGTATLRTPEELDELFAPIALYPDALVALILPAATVPADITQAANYLAANGDPGQIAGQPWNESVQSLAHYPEVMKWMNDNLAWTQEAGDAFFSQPADVMKSIQQLRARAIAAGSLKSTSEQQVIIDGNEIRIVPAQPDVIYVPRYDPDIVYDEEPNFIGPRLSFGAGFAAGAWLNYDLNWDNYGIWVGQWHPGWDYRRPAWRHPSGGVAAIGHAWRPPPGRRPVRPFDGSRGPREIVHPNLFAGTPVRPPQPRNPGPSPARGFRRDNQAGTTRPDFRGYPPRGQNRPAMTPAAPAPTPTPPRLPPARTRAPEPTSAPQPPGNLFGGYTRGSDARDASQRGQSSRQRGPAPAPAARTPPAQPPAANPTAPANPGGTGRGRGDSERKKN